MKNRKAHKLDLERKRPTFFLVGLIMVLSAVYGLFNLKTYAETTPICTSIPTVDSDWESSIITYREPIEEPKKVETKQVEKMVMKDFFISIPDGAEMKEQGLFDDEGLEVIQTFGEEVVLEIDVLALKKKPIFPGCEDIASDEERFECFKREMSQFIASHLMPCEGVFGTTKEKLYVQFVVDENGQASEVEVIRGNDVCNIERTQSVIQNLPTMQPGEAMGKKVRSRFVIPINIK